jgi:hypothetical protein
MARSDEDFAFMDDIDRLTGVLNGVAQELDSLAESLEADDTECEELNVGKTAEEIAEEDALAAAIAAPLVSALDDISAILNKASAEVCGMTAEMVDSHEDAEV